ncbi:MAG: TlyA family RNA methyltransferase, partial [Clostridia bacterium]|nr:TlyA family RNA methyltransferase [Clostridia bacterium]
LLAHGAARVHAVDVGYGQLAWKLRNDPRVVVIERMNIRNLTAAELPEPLDFATVDVSFISLTLVLPVVRGFLKPDGQAVCLIKPQFEAGRGRVGKKGVVREPELHAEVVEKIATFAAENGFAVLGLDFSPVKGPEGNIEYLIHLQKAQAGCAFGGDIGALVEESHKKLGGDQR